MTGFGKAKINLENKSFTIEIKSLNSKYVDASIKMSSIYKDKEIELRRLISDKLQRGKIELLIWREDSESSSNYTLNSEAVSDYYKQIKQISDKLNITSNDIMPSLLRMPNVIQKGDEKVGENDWNEIKKGIEAAITNLLTFRLHEGEKLEEDIDSRIKNIAQLLKKISPFAKERIQKIKTSLSEKLTLFDTNIIDKNRFEQELIYYLEKQDVTEEQVRLGAHLNYFTKSMRERSPNGKKLGFIAQEVGREINTIGSKSSDVNMQKIVVEMKDELEKIKEQLLNIL
jgi:uncharacterized protein (TIGR00255 family)